MSSEAGGGAAYAYTPHDRDPTLLEPFTYIDSIKGKDVRGKLIDAFQHWIQAPEERIVQIKEIISALHNASLLVDDIEDGSQLRRGVPVAHAIFGVPMTLNSANYMYFIALEQCHQLGSRRATDVFVSELLNLHRGQGQEIVWRDRVQCPTEAQYTAMVLDKTGGLFRLAVGLMQAFEGGGCEASAPPIDGASAPCPPDPLGSATSSSGAPPASASPPSPPSPSRDYAPLTNKLALYFQIRDDYINLLSDAYMKSKSFCEDLTEGKFSYPIIHAVRARADDTRLVNILKQRTEDVHVKQHAVDFMRSLGSFDYTRATLRRLRCEVDEEIAKLGGHAKVRRGRSCSHRIHRIVGC
jgi:geranylgeranyl diphosphate synthase type 3